MLEGHMHGRILFGVLLEEKIGHYSQLGDFHSHVKTYLEYHYVIFY